MANIDIGPGATDRASTIAGAVCTHLFTENPANDSGSLTSFEVWAASNMSALKLGTFYFYIDGYRVRDYESIGAVTAGSKQTFTGKSCSVTSGDYLGAYFADGSVEADATGSGAPYRYYKINYDTFSGGNYTYSTAEKNQASFYGTYTVAPPTVTTQSATVVLYDSCIANGNVTSEGDADCTTKGFCYKAGTSGDPTVSDSTIYDTGSFSTGAYTRQITGLAANTSYRVRAYAINSGGTSYGDTVQVVTAVRPSLEIDFMEFAENVVAAAKYSSDGGAELVATSEATTKTEGSYALKGAASTSAVNKKFTRTLSPLLNLSGAETLTVDIRSTRTGSNIKIGLHDSGGTTTEITPNIVSADTYQEVSFDISSVTDANKDAIDQIIITVVNADAANTFYVDNFKIAGAAALTDIFGMVG